MILYNDGRILMQYDYIHLNYDDDFDYTAGLNFGDGNYGNSLVFDTIPLENFAI